MLILASRSPRRSELLQRAGIPFVTQPAEVDETPRNGETPEQYVKRIAELKALAVEADPKDIVLGADTAVVIDNRVLGKPADRADAARMLHTLSGRKHEVATGVCLKQGGQTMVDWAVTQVWFAVMSAEEIEEYVASGEPMDKAGAYAVQGLASKFIERIDGCYTNVVGLPIALVYKHLRLSP
jgi:septum formation protein